MNQSMNPAERTSVLLGVQTRAREMIEKGATLRSVLEHLCNAVEELSRGESVASILLLDGENRLRNGASPSLPADYLAAIDGLRADPNIGTCASAAATGEVVVTPDFRADQRWAELKHLPLALGFRAAWSQPIKAPSGRVLGTFGTYFRSLRTPTSEERGMVCLLASTAALAIGRLQAVAA